MAEFYTAISAEEIARQIADMLNAHNKLTLIHTMPGLIQAHGKYFIEIDKKKVIACQALQKESDNLTKLYHSCVLPEYRRQGIAKRLLQIAIQNSPTPYVYATIRGDNEASLNMVKALGFVVAKTEWNKDHQVITVGRRTT